MRQLLAASLPPTEGERAGVGQAFPHPELDPEILPNEQAPAGLAPNPESSLGQGGGEAAAWLFLLSPPAGETPAALAAAAPPEPTPRGVEAEPGLLAERWVRRLAWGGDGRRGVARLELGQGALAGAELMITTEPGQVTVELALPAASDARVHEGLRQRLEARGYLTTITVR